MINAEEIIGNRKGSELNDIDPQFDDQSRVASS
jgi:hypothetical protein